MKTFVVWLEMAMRTQMKFGYPDGYGAALYPMAYHTPTASDAYIDMQFRREQEDYAPPDTALPDSEADKAIMAYREKMGVLPKLSGKDFMKGFTHHDGVGLVWLHYMPKHHHVTRPPSIHMNFKDFVKHGSL